jgi:hypothetical protein
MGWMAPSPGLRVVSFATLSSGRRRGFGVGTAVARGPYSNNLMMEACTSPGSTWATRLELPRCSGAYLPEPDAHATAGVPNGGASGDLDVGAIVAEVVSARLTTSNNYSLAFLGHIREFRMATIR